MNRYTLYLDIGIESCIEEVDYSDGVMHLHMDCHLGGPYPWAVDIRTPLINTWNYTEVTNVAI